MSWAIDASALIAFLRDEPGADVAARHLRRSCLSAVKLAEVLEKTPDRDDGAEWSKFQKQREAERKARDSQRFVRLGSSRPWHSGHYRGRGYVFAPHRIVQRFVLSSAVACR